MEYDFAGETAIVTGAGSGIGRRVARRLATEGAQVVVADVDTEGAATTVEQIDDAGGTATVVETDVTDADDVRSMVETAVDTYGGLDIAVNNAGIEGDSAPLAEQSVDNWEAVIGVNLRGVWLSLKHELPELVDGGGGAVVNTASIAGEVAAGAAPYVASKHGVIGLTRVAAAEYAESEVRVNAVSPGVIDTPMVERARTADEAALDQFVGMQPLDRMGTTTEVANAVTWLCSDEASFVTGSAYPVDGGYLAR